MPQIRKFEQDAIVDKTLASCVSNKEEVIYQLEGTSEYRKIKDDFDNILELQKQEKVLEKQISSEKDRLNDAVDAFNKDVLKSSPIYKLEYNSACWRDNESLRFNSDIGSYSTVGNTIANEIAIALLPKDAVNDIESIIERIADNLRFDLA
jgi:hypothetical protein